MYKIIKLNKFILFIPLQINEINELRRQLIDNFAEIRKNNYKTQKQKTIKYTPYFSTELDYKANINNEKAKDFYEKCGNKDDYDAFITRPDFMRVEYKEFYLDK